MRKKTGVRRLVKQWLAGILTLALCLPLIPALPAGAEDVPVDFEDGSLNRFVCSQEGGVTIGTWEGGRYMNLSPTGDGALAFAEYKLSYGQGVPLDLALDFKINEFVGSGHTVASLVKDGAPSLDIETRDGGLAAATEGDSWQVLAESLLPNRWYKLRLHVDFLAETYSVWLDGAAILENQPTLNQNGRADSLVFSTRYTPGFGVDNLTVGENQSLLSVELTGENSLILADGQEGSLDFQATAYDSNGVAMENPEEFRFSVLPADSGVQVTGEGAAAHLTFSSQAPAGEYTLYAASGVAVQSRIVTLERYTPQYTTLKITGPAKLRPYLKGYDTYTYQVEAADQLGNPMETPQVLYALEGEVPDTLELNRSAGVIRVTGDLPKDRHLTLRAVMQDEGMLSAEKTLTLLDEETYLADEYRFTTLLEYIDRVRQYGRDPFHGTPLLATALNLYTMKPAVWRALTKSGTPSNLADQGNWFRSLDALYKLTGDEQYKKEITDTYQMYLDRYMLPCGLPAWGGHIYVNMENGEINFGYNADYHELKTHNPYMEPFFELDPEAARRIAIGLWEGEVTDWSTMMFNRHVEAHKTYDESHWNNPNGLNYTEPEWGYNVLRTSGVSFRVAGNDLLYMATELYRHGRDQDLIRTYTKRLLERFYAASDPETNMTVFQFNTLDGAPGTLDPMTELEPKGAWWKAWPMPAYYTYGTYGDRFKNQFSDDLVAEGFVSPDKEWILREPWEKRGPESELYDPFYETELVKTLGMDTPEGQMIVDHVMKSLGNYIKYAYDFDRDRFRPIMVDGTNLEGFVWKRRGYYGAPGNTFSAIKTDERLLIAYIKAYTELMDVPGYEEERANMWAFIRNAMRWRGMGDPGPERPGENMNLDYATAESTPDMLIGMLFFYLKTGNHDFLDMARIIGSNIIKNQMEEGFFVYDTDRQYIALFGDNGNFIYAFTFLEAVIRGEEDVMPTFYQYDGYYEDSAIYEGSLRESNQVHDTGPWYEQVYTPVKAVDVILPEEVAMTPGQTAELEMTVEPDDTTDKGVTIVSSDPGCVSVDYVTQALRAIRPGEAVITVIPKSNLFVKKEVKVYVREAGEGEEDEEDE